MCSWYILSVLRTDFSPTRVCWSGPPPASTARPRSHAHTRSSHAHTRSPPRARVVKVEVWIFSGEVCIVNSIVTT